MTWPRWRKPRPPLGLEELNKNGFLPVLPDVHKFTILIDVFGSYPLSPRSSVSGWLLEYFSLVVISAFLGACTLGHETRQRVAIETREETRTDLLRDAAVEDQRAEPVEPAKKVGGEGVEVATLEIDLTNFKDRLATLSGAEVVELIGPPEFERFEPPARIWQYRALLRCGSLFIR